MQELQKLLNQAHKDYKTNLDNLREAGAFQIEELYERGVPQMWEVQDVIKDYTHAAQQLADNYYETLRQLWQEYGGKQFPQFDHTKRVEFMRVLWQQQGGFNDTDYAGLTYQQVRDGLARSGLTLEDLWPDLSNMDDAQQLLADLVNTGARMQTLLNMRHDPHTPRYARVPRGSKTCAFCTMLASRGFVYWSAKTAGENNAYHHLCDCQIVVSWGSQTLEDYDPEHYQEMYQQARETTNHPKNYREVLKTMRRQNPDNLTDGVDPQWNESRKSLSMKGQKQDTPASWRQRQENVGVSLSKGQLKYHEIVFLEKFKELGNSFDWITEGGDKPKNDFIWKNHDNVEVELKSPHSTKYKSIADRISTSVSSARKQGVTKSVFVIDYGDTPLPDKLVYQLSLYNKRHESLQHIKELWIRDSKGLRQITLIK